jgi:hypothetical protein
MPEVRIYAEELGLSLEEARARIEQQNALGPTTLALEAVLPDRNAGVWLEHTPRLRLVAWFTGGSTGLDEAREIGNSAPIPVEVRTGAPKSRLALLAVANQASQRNSDGIAGVGIDVQTNQVVVDLQPDSEWTTSLAAFEEALEADFETPFQVNVLPSVAKDNSTYGGKKITSATNPDCTTAFSVANYAGATGVFTNAHCASKNLYWETVSTSHAVQFVAQAYDAYRDVQWLSVVGTEYARFFDGTSLRSVNYTKARADQVIGTLVCHYGINTGYSCGRLTQKDYKPVYSGACPGGPCAQSWMKVDDWLSQDVSCDDGDSGGPWFVATTAYGVHKGSPGSSCIHMAIDFISAMGVYVLTE